MANKKYTLGSDGYYQTKVWDGTYTKSGHKHRITLRSAKSSRDLERQVAEMKAQVEARNFVRDTNILFIDYARSWKLVYKARTSNNTKRMYDNIIEKHFTALGTVKLMDIQRIHIETLLSNADGHARTQQQILLTFSQILKSAVVDKLLAANVAEEVLRNTDKVKYKPKENRALTPAEKKAVFEANYKYAADQAYLYLIYGCGLRREECVALSVFDFNFKKSELSISRAYEYIVNDAGEKGTKTWNSVRTVPIPQKVLPVIRDYVDSVKRSGRTQLFVTMKDKKPFTKSAYDRMWERILTSMQAACEEKIVGLTGHVFRHNYCSSLCYQIPKISIKRIAELMGDTEDMVMKVYSHILAEKEDVDGAVNAAINF